MQAQRETIEAQKKLAAEQQKRAESSSIANAQHQLQLQQQQQQQLQQQMQAHTMRVHLFWTEELRKIQEMDPGPQMWLFYVFFIFIFYKI